MPVIVAAVGVGGWFLYDAYGGRAQSRAEITEACQGLVDPGAVMWFGSPRVDAAPAGDAVCVLRRAVTFEGQEEMHEFVSLAVAASKDAEPGESRFEHDVRSVTAVAKCADPARSAAVTSLRVTAATEGDGPGRGKPGFLSGLAREAALRAAVKAGCGTTLPAAPKV